MAILSMFLTGRSPRSSSGKQVRSLKRILIYVSNNNVVNNVSNNNIDYNNNIV